ncbi:hypothetical protein EYF80_010430 [Liparis tanakae]|uniref:Uncharacterized protein n=1 Tax=Liparis tanakae TaxID=230148 RepID=A0A4Z2ING0_9TELE|nr:hypothetical protein EYF80_010430 [Liparis tanakae]
MAGLSSIGPYIHVYGKASQSRVHVQTLAQRWDGDWHGAAAISLLPNTSEQSDSTASSLSICTKRSCRPSLMPPISSRFRPKLSARCLHVFTTAASLL